MKPFLKRLFRYRQSGARTPTEDFLSEVLADFLSRAPRTAGVALLADCFVPPELVPALLAVCAEGDLAFGTQVRLKDGKILDILVRHDARPIIVVEVKIGTRFQRHAVDRPAELGAGPDAVAETVHQLASYGRWLREAPSVAGWPGVVSLLTHQVAPPVDFTADNIGIYGAVPHIVHWRMVHAALRSLVGNDDAEPLAPAWMFVGRELCRFLEDQKMSSSDLTSTDIAALNVAMEPSRSLPGIFSEVRTEITHRRPGQLNARKTDWNNEPENSRIWRWTYFEGAGKVYLGYGLYLAPAGGELATAEPPMPEVDHAFLSVGSDIAGLALSHDPVPSGWHAMTERFQFVKPLPLVDRERGEHLPTFLLRKLAEEAPAIAALHQGFIASAPGAGEG